MTLDLTPEEADFLADSISWKEIEGFTKGEEIIAHRFKDYIHEKFPDVAHDYWWFRGCNCPKKGE